MTTFSVGDLVTWRLHPDVGQGEVLVFISSKTLGVRFENYYDYDDDSENRDYPDLPDFHYVSVEHAIPVTYKYNPDQAGDTDEDI